MGMSVFQAHLLADISTGWLNVRHNHMNYYVTFGVTYGALCESLRYLIPSRDTLATADVHCVLRLVTVLQRQRN